MQIVNPLSAYAFGQPIEVGGGLYMFGVEEKQGRRFSARGWRAAMDGWTLNADVYGTTLRSQLRPYSRPVLLQARADYEAKRVPDFPPYHIIEPTSICNRACPFCPISALNDSRAAKKRMDWTDALAFFTECGTHHVYGLSLYQLGEPMLWSGHTPSGTRVDIGHMIAAAKSIGGFQAVNVSTNGDVPNLAILLSAPVDDVIVSIDGTTAEVYAENRPSTAAHDPGAFERTLVRVRAFLDAKAARAGMHVPYVRLQIINKGNTKAQIEDFIRYWIAVPGVDDVYVKNLDSMRPWVGNAAVSLEEEAAKIARVKAMPCQHLWSVGSMTAEGRLNACCHDSRTELTDGSTIRDTPFHDWWHGPFMTRLRAEHVRGEFRAPCATCAERDCWLG